MRSSTCRARASRFSRKLSQCGLLVSIEKNAAFALLRNSGGATVRDLISTPVKPSDTKSGIADRPDSLQASGPSSESAVSPSGPPRARIGRRFSLNNRAGRTTRKRRRFSNNSVFHCNATTLAGFSKTSFRRRPDKTVSKDFTISSAA